MLSAKTFFSNILISLPPGYFAKITSLPWMCDKIVDENPRTKRQGIKRENAMPDDGSKNTKATRNV